MLKKIKCHFLHALANYKLRHGDIDGYNKTVYMIRELLR